MRTSPGMFADASTTVAVAVDDLHEVLVASRHRERMAEVAVVDRRGDVLRSQPGGGLEVLGEGAAVRVHQPERADHERGADDDHRRRR